MRAGIEITNNDKKYFELIKYCSEKKWLNRYHYKFLYSLIHYGENMQKFLFFVRAEFIFQPWKKESQ